MRPLKSSIRALTPEICTDSNPATTRMAGTMVPMMHFVSRLMRLAGSANVTDPTNCLYAS